MEDLCFQPKFAGAFRLGGFRLELHRVAIPTEDDDFEIHVIDLGDAASPTLRLDIDDCETIIGGLRFLKAMKAVDRGAASPEALIEGLRSMTKAPRELSIEKVMLELDGQRHSENGGTAAERDEMQSPSREVAS